MVISFTTPNSEIITMLDTIEDEISSTCEEKDDMSADWCPYGCCQTVTVYDDIIAEIFARFRIKIKK